MLRPLVPWVCVALLVTGCAGGSGQSPRGTPTPLAATPTPAPTSAASPGGSGSLGDLAASPSPAAQVSPAPSTPEAQASPRVDAVLAKGITESHEPTEVTTQFTDADERIYVVHAASLPKGATFLATLVAVSAEGIDPNSEVETSCIPSGCGRHSDTNPVKEGRRSVLILPAPISGFPPGEYRIDLKVQCWNTTPCTDAQSSVAVKLVPSLPSPETAEQAAQLQGINIAAAGLGGRVISATSQRNDTSRSAANLIDGHATIITDFQDCEYSCGWYSVERTTDKVEAHRKVFPQDIVLAFYKQREAIIIAVVVDTTPFQHWHQVPLLPRNVEVWVSATTPTDGFTKVAAVRLPRRNGVSLIRFPATRAKYVRLRILSNYEGRAVWIGEVRVIEDPTAPSVLADAERNLALFALGGVVVHFTSVRGHHMIGTLIDGSTEVPLPDVSEVPRNWVSADDALPQEFLFAFRGDQVALIDRIVLTTKPDAPLTGRSPDSDAADPDNWPKQIAVSVSSDTPFDGFEEVGQFTLKQVPAPQSFPINRRARFLKLRILSNYGGHRTALNDVKILEGTAPGYKSILVTPEAQLTVAANVAPPVDETGIDLEKEANNAPAEANPLRLGRRLRGSIDPLGEADYFRLTIPGSNRTVLTLGLEGRPNIRTSISLSDPSGKAILNFDPRRATARKAEYSWLVSPGEYLARVTEPQASVVLIWDTSGSMGEESVKNLKLAVEAYLDKVEPTERYNLIRFSGDSRSKDPPAIEVLLPEFTSDRARLKASVGGKFFSKGGTPLYDAVAKGIQLLEGVSGNRAIVVMTDGIDSTSELGRIPPGGSERAGRMTNFWRLLEDKRIRLYTIGLGLDMPPYYPEVGTTGTRFLAHAAMATTARSFFTANPEELTRIYEQIAAELRTPSTYYLRPSISPGLGTLSVTATGERLEAVAAPSQIELILDVSGSMKRQIEGRQMMDIAKDVMVQVIKGLPDDARVALRFYGHRIREGRRGDCQDSELVFPFGRINKAAMIARVRALKALGTTPIAYTLRQVAKDFGTAPGEKLVILVTDGKEECGGSPSAVVGEMVAKGIKVRLNIVGFALAEAAVRAEMERVAKITGGKFYDAQNAKALRQAIQQSLAIPYEVRDAAGVRVAGGLTGEAPVKVPEGIYTVTVRAAGAPIVVPQVRVRYQGFTKVALRKEGQQIGVKVTGP